MGNSVLTEIGGFLWSHPYVTFSLLALFTPPFFPILKFFFPLLISTAVFIVALVTMGPQIEGSSDDGFEPHGVPEEKTSDGKVERLKDGERESEIQKPGKEKITWRDRVQKCKQTGLHWIEQQLRNDNWRGASLNDDNVSILEEAFAHRLPARPVEFKSIPPERIFDKSVQDEPNLERVQVRDVSKSEPWESFSGGDCEMPPPPFTLDNDTRDLPHDFFSPHPSFRRISHEFDEDIMRPPIEFDMPPVITGPASVTAPFMMKEPEPERVVGIDTDSYDDSDHHECHHDDDDFTESEDERDLSPKILPEVLADSQDQPMASTDIQEGEIGLPIEPSPPSPPPELEEESLSPVPDSEEQTSTPSEIHDETATPSNSVQEEVSIPGTEIDPASIEPALDAPDEQFAPKLESHEDIVPPATIMHEERSIPVTEVYEEDLVPIVTVEEGSVDAAPDLHDIPDLVDISHPEPEEPPLEAAAHEEPPHEEPVLEMAAHEEPVLETTAHEEPALETAAREEPALEEPAVDMAAREVPADEEPAVDMAAREEPAVDMAAREEPADQEPAVDMAAREEPADQEPAVDMAAREEPADEEPAVGMAACEEPADEEPAVDMAACEQPAHGEVAREEPAHEEVVCEDSSIPEANKLDDAEEIQVIHSVASEQADTSADTDDHSHGSQGTAMNLSAPSVIQEEPPQSLEGSLPLPSPEELRATVAADCATESTPAPPMTMKDPPPSEDIQEQPPQLDHSVSLPATSSTSVHSHAALEPIILPSKIFEIGPASPDTDIGGDSTPERGRKWSLVGQLSSSEINNSLTSGDEIESPRAVPAKLYKEKLLSLDALANSIVESPSPETKSRLLDRSKGQPPTTDEKVSRVTDKLKGFIEDGPSRRFQPDAPELQITPPSGKFSITALPSRSLMVSPARKPSIVPPPPARNIRPQVSSSDESSEDGVDLDSDIEIVGTDSDSDTDSFNYAKLRPPPKLPPHLRQTSARA